MNTTRFRPRPLLRGSIGSYRAHEVGGMEINELTTHEGWLWTDKPATVKP